MITLQEPAYAKLNLTLDILGKRPDGYHDLRSVMQQITLREGVYAYMTGPQYETPAEIRALRVLGADAVGMSTVPEAVVAGHCGMQVLGLSLLANMAAGILPQPLTEQEVLDAAQAGRAKFSGLLRGFLSKL